MSNWKKHGGIYNLENNNNVSVYSLVADLFTLRQSYYGTFDISGELHVSGNARIDLHLRVKSITVLEDISTNRLFVNNRSYFYNNIDVSGNLSVSNGNLNVLTNVNVLGVIQLQNQLYLGNTNNAYLFGTDIIGNIGMNTTNPVAVFDIASSRPIAFNVGTSSLEQMSSIPIQNRNNRGIVLSANTINSQIRFFNDSSINTGVVNGTITYSNGGIMTLDVSDNTNILSKVSISNRENAITTHVMSETAVIYDISAGTYLPQVYQNSTENTGNALSLITNDSSSNTFMNIITPSKKGISIGGGVYPNDQTRAMGTIGWRDTNAIFTPAINVVSGNSYVRQKTTVGINTHSPSVDNYAFDINGPVRMKNGELTITSQQNIEILSLAVGKNNASKNAVAVGTPYTNTGTPYTHKHKILYTNNGGETWIESFDLSGDSIETRRINLNATYVYDSSLSVIAGDYGYVYYTYYGYVKPSIPNYNVAWQTVSTRYNNSANALNYSIKSIYVTSPSKRAFFGMDSSGTTSFLHWFTMRDASNGFTSTGDASLNLTPYSGIKSMDGFNNTLWVVVGTRILSINTDMPTGYVDSGLVGAYNSISILDANNIIAGGNGILSFSTNGGTNWTTTNTGVPTINQIRLIDASDAIAVCNSGIVYVSSNWSNLASWRILSSDELNGSGNASRLIDPSKNLRTLGVVDSSNFYITKTIQSYTSSLLGNSSLFHAHLPNVFNNPTNFILDISGSVRTSGDININEGGKVKSNNSTFYLVNEGVNQLYFGGDASNVYIGSQNSTVALNSKLTTESDATFKNDINVNRRIRNSIIESISGIIERGPVTTGLNAYDLYIGASDFTDVSNRTIRIGNFNNSPYTRNNIQIGGVNDEVFIYGNITQVKNTKVGPILYLNSAYLNAGGSGLHFGDNNGNPDSGYFAISNDRKGYIFKSTQGANIIKLDVSNLVIPPTQTTGFVSIYRESNQSDSSYNLYTSSIDPSNVILSVTNYSQDIYANLTLRQNGNILESLTVSKNTNISGSVVVGGTLAVTGNTVLSNLAVNANTNVSGNTVIGGTLQVTANTSLSNLGVSNNTNVSGIVVVGGTLRVTGNTSLSNINASNNGIVGGTLTVTGNTLLSNLAVTANTNVSGNVVVGGTLSVTGNTVLSNLAVTASTNISGSTIVGGTLGVTGNTTLSNLAVTASTNISGGTIIGGTLSVTGNTMLSNLAVTANTNVSGNVVVGGTLSVTGNTVLSNLTVTASANISGSTVIGGNLRITGNTILSNTYINTGNVITFNGSGIVLDATFSKNNIRFGNVVTFTDDQYTTVIGVDNTSVGVNALTRITTASYNTAIGRTALNLLQSGYYNVAIGSDSQYYNVDGDYNTSIGQGSLYNVLGNYNTGIGANAGVDIITGNNNTFLGYDSGSDKNYYSNTTAIGTGAITRANNHIAIGTSTENTTIGMDTAPDSNYTLSVGGNILLNNLDVNMNANISTNANINGILSVTGNTFLSNLAVTANTNVSGNVVVGGTLRVTGNTLLSNLAVTSSTIIGGTLGVTGVTTVGGTLNVTGGTVVGGTLGVTGNTTLSNLAVTASANISGSTIIGGTLSVTGGTTVGGTLGVTGSTTVGGTLGVTGNTTLSNLAVTASANISGSTIIGGTLGVTGNTTLSNLAVTASANISGSTIIGGTLSVTGGTTVGGTLGVTGSTTVGGTLGVTGSTTVGGTLGVTGVTTLSNLAVTARANISGSTIIGGTLGVTGVTTVGGTLDVTGNTTLSNLTVRPSLLVVGNIFHSNVFLNQTANITGNTTLSYPLYNSYNITNTNASSLSITLPDISAGQSKAGSVINFFKTGNLTSQVQITSTNDKFITNGEITLNNSFLIPSGTTSAALISSFGSPNYWTAIGGGGGGGISGGNMTVAGNLTVTGSTTLPNIIFSNTDFILNASNNTTKNVRFASPSTTTNAGSYNTSIGFNASPNLTTGNYNTCIGFESLKQNSGGSFNTAIGALTGNTYPSIGNYNTFIGYNARAAENYSLTTAIGYNAKTQREYHIAIGYVENYTTIGTDGPPAEGYKLTVGGSIQAVSYNATSDRRLKSNIQILPNQSKTILDVMPVTFDWKVDGKHDVGFIAQDVYKVYPELLPKHLTDPSINVDEPVDPSGNPIYHAMDYGRMTPFLWQGMREVLQRLDVLESENRELKLRIDKLEARG